MKNSLASSIDAISKILRRSNAMGPILIVIFMIAVVCSISIIYAEKVPSLICLAYIFGTVLGLAVLSAIGVYVYFAINNPRVLQSEHLQISMRQMDLVVASRGGSPSTYLNTDNNIQIENNKDSQQLNDTESTIDEKATRGENE